MNILLINLEFDCSGVAWNLRNALMASGHDVRHVMSRGTMVAQDTDMLFSSVYQILPWCEWADVLHFNQWVWSYTPGRPLAMSFNPTNYYGDAYSPFEPYLKSKRVVFHFHGGPHQVNPDYWLRECNRVGATVLKCDPVSPIDGARWLPNVIRVPEVKAVDPAMAPKRVMIMGSVNDSRRNNAHVMETLKFAGFDSVAAGEMEWHDCIRVRSQCGITVDNLTQGFIGMWSWEAMAMGQAVIARMDPRAVSAYAAMSGIGAPPVCDATNADWVTWWVRRLLGNRDTLRTVSRESKDWVSEAMSPARIAGMYLDVYSGR